MQWIKRRAKDKTAISKNKKATAKATTIGKAKQTKKTPRAIKETHTPDAVQDRGAVREHLVELPGKEWTVHSHFVHEDGRLMFGLDMYGIPLEPGEGWDYGEKGHLERWRKEKRSHVHQVESELSTLVNAPVADEANPEG
jgi:hypothetical protein